MSYKDIFIRTIFILQDVGPYGFYRNKNGLVVFLNYIKFPGVSNYRKGADKDKENVLTTFSLLQYGIDYHENLSKSETLSILENLRKDKRLWQIDSLILVISSHGVDRKTFITFQLFLELVY